MGELVEVLNMCIDYTDRIRELETHAYIGRPAATIDEAIKESRELKAIWDTGAFGTSITPRLADELGLIQSSETTIIGVTGSCLSRVFLISLFLPNGVIIPELEVSECPGDIGCDMLIGMDVITRGDFAISHKGGKTVFSYRVPSLERIDFTNPNSYGGSALKQPKIPRNSPCPCGSGKKYKHCHGAIFNP